MLLGALGASLSGNLLTGKKILRSGIGNNKGKGILRAGLRRPLSCSSKNNKKEWDFLMPPHHFEIQKYYKNEPRFNGIFSRNDLPEYNSIKKK